MIYLGANSTVTIDLSGYDPYGVYTIESDGFAGTFTFEQPCGQPALSVSVRCEAPVAFILRNDGAAMRAAQTFRVVDLTGADLTPNASSFMLDQGQTQQIIIPNVTDGGGLTLEVRSSAGVSAAVRMNCASLPQVTTPLPFTGFVVDGIGLPAWDGVPVCGRGCPDFQLYHSNETGDWEIFRLNGWDEAGRVTNRENLSLGEGVTDMAPSVSPNFEWVVFTSNRASIPGGPENWELYVAPTSGENPDHVQRLTFNQTAIDTDPVWGPNNWVVFETNRHGNWDLYAIDMSTGQEVRLTADTADDVNPYWSPDGQKIVFQSSRGGGFWQIWELDLRTLIARRLSDGSAIDVEPEYSPDGTQIAFRVYADTAANSQIALMNADGGDRALISDAAGDATNQVWSPEGALIAYQSDLDGDLDVYVYSAASGQTRQITDNDVDDYAPTWRCAGDQVIFTSDADASPDIYMADALPIEAESIRVEDDAEQMTFEPTDQIYPQGTPAEENASREGQTSQGVFGAQTAFLNPALDGVTIDLSIDGLAREDWPEVDACAGVRDDEDEDAA
jgi:TolB protein